MSDWREDLRKLLAPGRLSTRPADLDAAAADESTLPGRRPDAVVWPESTEEVATVVRFACARGIPVTPRGAGTSLEGNPIPLEGGIVVDFARMRSILELEPGDLTVRVEPGVVYAELNAALRHHGLFFPPHPGGSADTATVGGMLANNASGIYALGYGATRDYVRAVTVVVGTGEVVRLGSPCRKTSSGYHLVGLLVGSEGTLGLVTEITLALAPLPRSRKQAAFVFADEQKATAALSEMLRYGLDLAAAEFLDRRSVRALGSFLGKPFPQAALLLLELHGIPALVEETASSAESLAAEHGGEAAEGPESLWAAREHVTRAIQATRPGGRMVRADLALPVSRVPEMVERAYALAQETGLELFAFGHLGLGIVHLLAPLGPGDSREGAERLKDRLVEEALSRRGSVSGEHGLGFGNRKYAAREHGPSLALMRAIKSVFDPKGILNPGKLWE
ncbi:MAG: 2-hydroxy-acid oxidase [Candidatus Binatia bacterium]|nr:MAG: 2-hydroxy-acid oxidase [Candidatus Binatia bacterium]